MVLSGLGGLRSGLVKESVSLVPGMPVEAFIRTGERTAMSYLLKPLTDQFSRAMKER